MSFLYRLLTRTKQISPHIKKFESDWAFLLSAYG